jgi:SAM-dependent methyltransferase
MHAPRHPLAAPPAPHTYEGADLEAMVRADNYHAWIVSELAPYLGGDVAEVGAGSGNVSRHLLRAGVRHLSAVEPSREMYPRLVEALRGEPRATTHRALFEELVPRHRGAFDAVVYVNVLEHVEHDARELRLVHEALRPGGHVCIFVPALQWLYSAFDASVGHWRRYHRAPLRRLVEDAGFEVVRLRYFDAAGVLPWLVAFRWMGRSLNPRSVAAYDRWAVPVLRRLERVVTPPLGKNLLCVARRR